MLLGTLPQIFAFALPRVCTIAELQRMSDDQVVRFDLLPALVQYIDHSWQLAYIKTYLETVSMNRMPDYMTEMYEDDK